MKILQSSRWIFLAFFILDSLIVTSQIQNQPQAQQSFTFVQLCDPQLGFGGYQHDSISLVQAVQQINELNPDFVVICGDLVHNANDTSYSDFKLILSKLEMPYYPAPGNHDVEDNPTVESIEYYRNTIGADYYEKEYMDYSFVFVNSTLWMAPLEGESEKQDHWLRDKLSGLAEEQKPVFIIGHHPLFLQSPDEQGMNSSVSLEKRTELLALFSTANVIAYLSGHTHRTIINQYDDMQLICGESTSINFDKRPLGFRIWYVTGSSASHDFIPLVMEEIEIQ